MREEPLKTSLLLFAFGLGWAATTIPASLAAQDETPEDTTSAAENFELSLFPGVQLRGEDSSIQILRLGLYNKNVSVQGLDIGIVNQTTGGISKGLQIGVVGFVCAMLLMGNLMQLDVDVLERTREIARR